MKRASYRDAVDFIAMNDESAEMDPEEVIRLASVLLVSEIFAVSRERVTRDVIRLRAKNAKEDRRRETIAREGEYLKGE